MAFSHPLARGAKVWTAKAPAGADMGRPSEAFLINADCGRLLRAERAEAVFKLPRSAQ